jgi:hypothetical protein
MGNPHPKIENLKPHKKGDKKTGGRQQGTPNRLKPDDVMNIVDQCLRDNMTFSDINGNTQTKAGILWMIEGWIKNVARKGDVKGIELLLRIYGLLQDNLNLTGNVQINTDISADSIFAELGELADKVRDRESSDADESA